MRPVHVRIGHDDHAVVPQLGLVVVLTDVAPERRDQRTNRFALDHPFEPGLLHVEDLAPQRKDGLESAVSTLFCRSTGGRALDDVQLAQGRVFLAAVSERARE